MDASFNCLKSMVLEKRNMFENAIRMIKPGVQMTNWRFNLWDDDQKRCPEPYIFTEEEKTARIEALKVKKSEHIFRPIDKTRDPILYNYRQRVDRGNLQLKLILKRFFAKVSSIGAKKSVEKY